MLKNMNTKTHLKPEQKGTKLLVEKFGDALLCVRYRYDEKRGVRMTTVELVVEEKVLKPAAHYCDDDNVAVIVAYTEKTLQDKLKTVGGRWNPEEKLWHVPYGAIRDDVALTSRILPD